VVQKRHVNATDLYTMLACVIIMPCYDGRDNEPRIIYEDRDNPEDKRKIAELIDQNKKLEGGLCALITELEKKGIADEIITQASKSGLINLTDFWLHHSKEDETRLSIELHKFSEHEQEVLKRLLNAR
jgi:hypothetical protein